MLGLEVAVRGPAVDHAGRAASRRACPSSSCGCARAPPLAHELVAGRLVARPRRRAARARPRRGRGIEDVAHDRRRDGRCPSGSRSRAPSRSPSSGAPAVRHASACSGLRLERGRIERRRCRRAWRRRCRRRSRTIAEPGVTGLDESAAFDDGELDGVGCGEGLRHHASLPPGGRRCIRVPDCGACSASTATRSAPRGRATAGTGTSRLPRLRPLRRRSRSTASPTCSASSDKPFRGDPARWNPEDLLLAALSECHLLSYLHACVQAGVVVVGYRDDASGLMVEDGRGGGAFREVVLRPARDRRGCIDGGCRDRRARAGATSGASSRTR